MAGALCVGISAPVFALRCQGHIIDLGAQKFRVAHFCGQPDFSDSFVQSPGPGFGVAARVDHWYYNFGPSQLVRLLRFRNDRLEDEATEGYGYATLPRGECDTDDLRDGMSEFELLVRCGQPQERLARNQFTIFGPSGGLATVSPTRVQKWTYNLGGSRLVRHITLANGRVTAIETGERGFNTND